MVTNAKRKAYVEEESPRKRQRGPGRPPVETGRVAKATKRKAGTEAGTPSKRKSGDKTETDPSPRPRGPSSSHGKNALSIFFGSNSRGKLCEEENNCAPV